MLILRCSDTERREDAGRGSGNGGAVLRLAGTVAGTGAEVQAAIDYPAQENRGWKMKYGARIYT